MIFDGTSDCDQHSNDACDLYRTLGMVRIAPVKDKMTRVMVQNEFVSDDVGLSQLSA